MSKNSLRKIREQAWDEGFHAGHLWGYWGEREDVSKAADIDVTSNPYRTVTDKET